MKITMDHRTLKKMLNGVLFSLDVNQGIRLQHVLLQSKNDNLNFVTCDGFRISRQTMCYKTNEDFSLLLNPNGMKAVAAQLTNNLYDTVIININDEHEHINFELTGYTIAVNILDQQYIKYEDYLPKTYNLRHSIVIKPQEVLSLLPKDYKKEKHIKLDIPVESPILEFNVRTDDIIHQVNIEHEYSINREAVSILLNCRFLYETLKVFKKEEKVILSKFDGIKGITISAKDNKALYWILPIRE